MVFVRHRRASVGTESTRRCSYRSRSVAGSHGGEGVRRPGAERRRLGKATEQRGYVGCAHERVDGFARLQLVNAIGETTNATMQVVKLLIAFIETPLQIEDPNDAREVDALARQLVDQLETLDIGLGSTCACCRLCAEASPALSARTRAGSADERPRAPPQR